VHSHAFPGMSYLPTGRKVWADEEADHEDRVASIASDIGFHLISVSSSLSPNIKILSRTTSACVDAYLSPHVKRYVDGFTASFSVQPGRIEFMQSDGGLTVGDKFSGLKAILSGPAGGVVAIAATCYDEDEGTPIIGFDMVRSDETVKSDLFLLIIWREGRVQMCLDLKSHSSMSLIRLSAEPRSQLPCWMSRLLLLAAGRFCFGGVSYLLLALR